MDNEAFISAFAAFTEAKNIEKEVATNMLTNVLCALIENKFKDTKNFDVVINPDKGDIQIWRFRTIVADDDPEADSPYKIPLSQAKKIEDDFEIGEEVSEEIPLNIFRRRDLARALELLVSQRKGVERGKLYDIYKDRIGEVIHAEVFYMLRNITLLYDDQKNELILPIAHQIPREVLKKGERISAIIEDVLLKENQLDIVLSRSSPRFLAHLFETEIPEILDGIVKIENISRRPGVRAKVSVSSNDDRIDPVGACIGARGTRIQAIMRQVNNEQIDVIHYTENKDLYIARLLKPATIGTVKYYEDRISVYLQPDQVGLAIGMQGQNIDLAGKMLERPIDLYRELEDPKDFYLDEVRSDLPYLTYEALKAHNIDTATQVLKVTKEELAKKMNFGKDRVEELYTFLNTHYAS